MFLLNLMLTATAKANAISLKLTIQFSKIKTTKIPQTTKTGKTILPEQDY